MSGIESVNGRLHSAARAIQSCDVLIVTAGAGLSVDGGIPDYVDMKKAHPEIAHLGLSVYEISNAEVFVRNPRFAWGVYGKRMADYRRAVPHEGYGILLAWCRGKRDWWVYTSNIDRHFVRAGFPDERVVECHRSLYDLQCAVPCCDEVWDGQDTKVDFDKSTLMVTDEFPRCRRCGEAARPCTVLAVDDRWLGFFTEQRELRMDKQISQLPSATTIVVLEIGCGVQMPKVRKKSEEIVSRCRKRGNRTVFVRINPNKAHASILMAQQYSADNLSICETALTALQAINNLIFHV